MRAPPDIDKPKAEASSGPQLMTPDVQGLAFVTWPLPVQADDSGNHLPRLSPFLLPQSPLVRPPTTELTVNARWRRVYLLDSQTAENNSSPEAMARGTCPR
jgi:hypothetical protein